MGGNMYASRFLKAQHTYEDNAPIQIKMRWQLWNLLQQTKQNYFPAIFEFGCGQGGLTEILSKNLSFSKYICNDIHNYAMLHQYPNIEIKIFDMNLIDKQDIFHTRFDLIASNACLQWLDFDSTLHALHTMLHDNAFLLLGTFGEKNLQEVRAITGYGLPYLTKQQIQDTMQTKFTIINIEENFFTLHFKTSIEVFRHLQKSGVNSLSSVYLKKSWLQDYELRFHNKLTYHTVCFLAKKYK